MLAEVSISLGHFSQGHSLRKVRSPPRHLTPICSGKDRITDSQTKSRDTLIITNWQASKNATRLHLLLFSIYNMNLK